MGRRVRETRKGRRRAWRRRRRAYGTGWVRSRGVGEAR